MPNALIRKLNDKDGNVILPASRAVGIYFDDNSVLQDYVASNGVMNKALGDKNGKDLTSYVTGLSVNGRTVTYTKGDGTSGTIQTQDTDTTYPAFKGASANAAGGTGLVPAPAKGDQAKFLKADGTWGTPENTTYEEATTSTAGLMSSADKTKLNGIEAGANKTTVDTALSTSSANPVRNSVVTNALNKKASTSHSHSAATTSAAGFMSASDKTLLNSLSNSVIIDTSWGPSVPDIP